jgi:hypothetical protein
VLRSLASVLSTLLFGSGTKTPQATSEEREIANSSSLPVIGSELQLALMSASCGFFDIYIFLGKDRCRCLASTVQ